MPRAELRQSWLLLFSTNFSKFITQIAKAYSQGLPKVSLAVVRKSWVTFLVSLLPVWYTISCKQHSSFTDSLRVQPKLPYVLQNYTSVIPYTNSHHLIRVFAISVCSKNDLPFIRRRRRSRRFAVENQLIHSYSHTNIHSTVHSNTAVKSRKTFLRHFLYANGYSSSTQKHHVLQLYLLGSEVSSKPCAG